MVVDQTSRNSILARAAKTVIEVSAAGNDAAVRVYFGGLGWIVKLQVKGGHAVFLLECVRKGVPSQARRDGQSRRHFPVVAYIQIGTMSDVVRRVLVLQFGVLEGFPE